MQIRIHKSDGKTGIYRQDIPGRAATLLKRLAPQDVFRSGPIVIGVHTPFNVLNPDEICWIEIETHLEVARSFPPDINTIHRLAGRAEYESMLAQQWPLWRKHRKGKVRDPLEAFVELSMRSGDSVYLHVLGTVNDAKLVDLVFAQGAITATFEPGGTIYVNPKCIVRARIYHSKDRINYPAGTWIAEAEDI